MRLPITWVLVANSEHATIFEMVGRETNLIQEFEHLEARKKISELVSDKPGRTFQTASQERHSLNEGQDILSHERESFAARLVSFCKKQREARRFESLILIAAPKLLGDIRHFIPSSLAPSIKKEIPKEIPLYWPQNQKIAYMLNVIQE